jgi:hypothetical protein
MRRDGKLTSSHSLCKLFACYASSPFGVLSCVRPLTVSAFRLNSREYLRGRATTEYLSSIKIESLSESLGSKARQPSVHNSTTTDFGRNQSDHDVEPSTFDNRKTVCSKPLLATPRLIYVFCCRIQVSSFKGSVDHQNEARSLLLLARSWRNSE